ncbi:MAG TPA: glycosyltransferase family 2 protein [Bryobacteraceae bacterium]|nr:glycosyltransferase family 2 protein [Bryobacteraceae bacterium]
MTISAVVPVWNGRELLERLLDSLDKQTERAGEVLVLDNGSTDGAPEMARARGARVIAMGRNAGFAAAVNRGIREAAGEWIAVLNSDVELAPDYFALLGRSEGWFATGKILSASEPDRIDGTFDVVCRGGVAWRVGNRCADGPAYSVGRKIFSAPWTAALFRAALFERVGYLEERFESYYEDVDFGLRCTRLGLEGHYVPEAVAWHQGSATLGRWHADTVRRIARNQVWLVMRNYPGPLRRRWSWPIIVAQVLWGAVAMRHGAGWAWIRGKREGWRERAAAGATPNWNEKLLAAVCRDNERIMRNAPGLFWRMYFLLTGGGAE